MGMPMWGKSCPSFIPPLGKDNASRGKKDSLPRCAVSITFMVLTSYGIGFLLGIKGSSERKTLLLFTTPPNRPLPSVPVYEETIRGLVAGTDVSELDAMGQMKVILGWEQRRMLRGADCSLLLL